MAAKLDGVLQEFGVERLSGVHCYEFFTGSATFRGIAEAEAGSYYLTDFLARHFERIVIQGLGLDKRPELMDLYFGNYRRLVFLSQTDDPLCIDSSVVDALQAEQSGFTDQTREEIRAEIRKDMRRDGSPG